MTAARTDRLEALARVLLSWTTSYGQVQVDTDERVDFLTELLDALDKLDGVPADPAEPMPLGDYVPRPCPECVAGKHLNCTTQAWDDLADQPTVCPCHAAGHPAP